MSEDIPTGSIPSDRWAKVAGLLFFIALGITVYLAWQSMAGRTIAGCGPQSGCGKILTSRWSSLGGVPVSLLGAGIYMVLLVSALHVKTVTLWGRRIEVSASLLVLGGAVWFTIVQAFILKAFCPWCSTTHFLASLGVVVLWIARRKSPGYSETGTAGFASIVLPLAGVAGMAFLQIQMPESEHIEQRTVARALVSEAGKVSLYDGRITLDAAGLPGIGLPGASLTLVAITDFTCPHCRELHQTLVQLAGQRPGQFNVVMLPGAYEPEAREIHRIMLSLWRMDRDLYKTLAEELISGTVAPNVSVVTGWIQKRMDGKFFERAWHQADWVQNTLRQGEELLALNRLKAGAETLPQIMIRDRVLTGAPHLETLVGLIDAAPEDVTPAAVAAAEPAAVTTAVISFESTSIDLGTVTKGVLATKKVTFTNSGKSPLVITNIKAGCGCTTVAGWEQTVAPGKQGSFEIRLDTERFSGAVTKTVDVESNASNGLIRLTISANIWSPVEINPPTISFGPLPKGSPVEPRVIDVTVTDPEPLDIAGLTCSNPYFKAELKVVEPGRRYQVSVSVPELGDQPQSGEVILALGHPKMKELKLSTSISPVDPLMVQPQLLNVSAGTLKQSRSTSVTVFCHDPAVKELQVTDLAYLGEDNVVLTYEHEGNNRWGRVVLTFPPGFTWSAGKTASVSFHTNHPGYPSISVPVHFIGAPPEANLPDTSPGP